MKKHCQFFTTDTNSVGAESWFPIDHFFYAPSQRRGRNRKLVEEPKVVHLETHAAPFKKSGMGVSVVHGAEGTENPKWEEFDDIPSALRRMADIIEAHTKANKPVRRWMPKVGDRVKVSEGAGATSGRIGTIIPTKDIPTNHEGVPQIGGGHYDRMKKDEYAIREDGTGLLFTMFRNYLQKVD